MSTNDTSKAVAIKNASAPVTMRLENDELEEAQFLARRDHRTRASFLRLVYLRGLVVWKQENPSISI